MRADTFAKLIVVETLIDAEIGHFLEHRPASMERFREGMVARVSDLVDQIDALDAVAAARIYDAIVDFLAELPEDDPGVVDATLRFKRAVDRVIDRGLQERDLKQASTWAILLDELLEEMAKEYGRAVEDDGEIRAREYLRARTLLARSREAAERMLWSADAERRTEMRNAMDRLTFAVRYQRLQPASLDGLIRAPQSIARRHRASPLTRIGSFVVGQILRRPRADKEPHPA